MREFDWEIVEKNRMSLEDRAMLAVARVQGSWDQKSHDLLYKHSFLERTSWEEEEAKGIEKTLFRLATEKALAVLGEESKAAIMLGHSVTLSERDRGTLVLLDFVNEWNIEGLEDWKDLALITEEIAGGKNLAEVLENFKKKGENLGALGGILRRFDGDRGSKTKDFIEYLDELSGGSDKALLENKEEAQKKVLNSLGEQLSKVGSEKLLSLYKKLGKEFDNDPFLTSSFSAARKLIQEILQSKISDLTNVLSQLKTT